MGRLDRDLLDFALMWCPYGGGNDEDILVTFGLSPTAYFRRRLRLLVDGATTGLDGATRTRLITVCRQRLGTDIAVPAGVAA